ncbi:hypothetical protein [Cerasicoccus fimbriatus]|uniref:hypothetical protein n=1 Tax=Cerasicoccus fimbriatus TaxID=3014554 RepID=UPI0022B426EC|nr:hypothetical protein [Cerasicoccus sp. TK19100]
MDTHPELPLPVFSTDSYWNQPIPANAKADNFSNHWVKLLSEVRPGMGMHINLENWTIPVFKADNTTPRHKLKPKLLRCHLSQGHVKASERKLNGTHPLGLHHSVRDIEIPIPDHAAPDAQQDAHMSIVDTDNGRVYDLWQCRREADGSWHTNSAIAYELGGSGVFTQNDLEGIENDESVHFYGPCRASGVPLLAGLILQEEITRGHIAHKLAFACQVPALQRHVSPPVCWTDGWHPSGLPQGCTLQLNPDLDLDQFSLSAAARVVARALQEYGAILVDYADSVTLSGELLSPHTGMSWSQLLDEEALSSIGFENYRVIETGPTCNMGSHPVYHQGISKRYYDYIENQGAEELVDHEPWRKALP